MEEINLKDYFLVLNKRKWLVLFTTIMFIVVSGVMVNISTKPVYKTYTSLIVEESKTYSDPDSNQKYLDQKFMNTYSEIAKSKLVIDEVKKNLKLDSGFEDLSEKIEISVISDTDIIQIKVTGENPDLIAKVANEIAKVSIKHVNDMTDVKNIKVIDEAQIPKKQVNSVSKAKIVIAGLLGLFIGIILSFILAYFDNTVRIPRDIEKHLGLSVKGIIPKTEKNLIVYEEPNSFAAEGYRSLRTNIQAIKRKKRINTILITSPSPNEDTDIVSINTALSIAQAKEKVLLIDGNLRDSKIHKFLELKNDKGLSNVLNGEIDYKETIKKIKIEKNLDILTSGSISPNPSELLSSDRMYSLMEKVKNQYDTVVVNSSSLGWITDATVLSTTVEGILLLCNSGDTDINEAKKGKEILEKVNVDIIGAILNKIDIEKNNYYYNSYLYYEKYHNIIGED